MVVMKKLTVAQIATLQAGGLLGFVIDHALELALKTLAAVEEFDLFQIVREEIDRRDAARRSLV